MMVLPLASALGRIEDSVRTLGATSWRIFRRITVPLSLPGLVPSVIDFTDNLRIDGSAMTEMHRDRETDCREEVRGEAERGGAGTA
jgi:hypothetical protein